MAGIAIHLWLHLMAAIDAVSGLKNVSDLEPNAFPCGPSKTDVMSTPQPSAPSRCPFVDRTPPESGSLAATRRLRSGITRSHRCRRQCGFIPDFSQHIAAVSEV